VHTFVLTFVFEYAMLRKMAKKQTIEELVTACESAKEDVMSVLDDVRKNVHETNLMVKAFQAEQIDV